jgi:hypothetical protein
MNTYTDGWHSGIYSCSTFPIDLESGVRRQARVANRIKGAYFFVWHPSAAGAVCLAGYT